MPGEQGVVTGTKRRNAGLFAERTMVLSAKRFPDISLRFRGRIPLLRPERMYASDVVMEKADAATEYCRFLPAVQAASNRQPSLYCIGGIIMWKNGEPVKHDSVCLLDNPARKPAGIEEEAEYGARRTPVSHPSAANNGCREKKGRKQVEFGRLTDVRVLTAAGLLSLREGARRAKLDETEFLRQLKAAYPNFQPA